MKLLIPPPLVGLIIAGLMWLVAMRLGAALSFDFPARKTIAWMIAAPGIAIELIAVASFFHARTTVNPMAPGRTSKLVTGGLYRISRNPMYLGLGIVLTAWAVALGNPLNAGLLALFIWYITEFQIKPEEAAMREKFGADYEAYCSRTRRWI
ncbi:MAG: isoprenylcysteine carboxylmethyltransferase family protein [Pseudomonadota bacterium]